MKPLNPHEKAIYDIYISHDRNIDEVVKETAMNHNHIDKIIKRCERKMNDENHLDKIIDKCKGVLDGT